MKTNLLVIMCCLLGLIPVVLHAACWDQIWEEQNLQAFMKVDFINDQVGWGIRSSGLNSGSILHTTDGGSHWAVQYSPNYRLENIDFVDANNGWAVGYYSIFRTADGGLTWTRTYVDHATMLGVSFVDANNGWVVGDDLAGGNSPIWHTTNGGVSWNSQSSGTIYGLNEVSFPDVNHGCAVGLGGVIVNTSDGGATWIPRSSGTSYSLSGISIPPNQIFGLAVGGHGTILATFDGGASWSAATSGTTASLYDVAMCDMNGWVVGDSCLVLRTANAGFEWTREHSNFSIYPLLLGVACHGERAWAVGYDVGSWNVVLQNACAAPHDVVAKFNPGFPPFGLSILWLIWSPVAPAGSVTYLVYQDSLANGPFLSLAGSTTDTTMPFLGPNNSRMYYIVKTQTP